MGRAQRIHRQTGRLILSVACLLLLTVTLTCGQPSSDPPAEVAATHHPPQHRQSAPGKKHIANTGAYAEVAQGKQKKPLTDTPDSPSSGLPVSSEPHVSYAHGTKTVPKPREEAAADSSSSASSSPTPTASPTEGSRDPPVPGGAVAGTSSTPVPDGSNQDATLVRPAKNPMQPPVLPTYDLTHSPSTSRPSNPPPSVPNAPTNTPVPPTAQPPKNPQEGKDIRGLAPVHPEVDGHNAEPLNPAPKEQQQPKKDMTTANEGADDDDMIISDDPHSLPIPSRVSSPSGFPLPQQDPLVHTTTRSPPTGAKSSVPPSGPSAAQPHDPLVHIQPPPTGGWRAGDLRRREKMEEEVKRSKGTLSSSSSSSSEGKKADSSDGDVPPPSDSGDHPTPTFSTNTGSNSYISPHGPSAALRRNQSQWFSPPDIQGPMPFVDAATYKPAAAPEYWTPDEAHIQMLVERHEKLRKHKVHREGSGARTTRLASVDTPKVVDIRNNMLFVDGEPFWIQGICYSPVPIGESVSFSPKGDYFTPDFAYIWQRDLPLIKAMGATTLRIYGWAAWADHTMFLDAVHAAGLKVLVTYYLGDATQNPVWTQDQRNQILIDFVAQVHRYRDHPAILMWSFGNELNGAWNGFAKQFSDAFTCWWQAGCAGYSDTNSDCQWQSTCMYFQLFSWINAACRAAKMVTTRPIISGFADVDYMVGPTPWLDKVARFNYVLPDMDAWAVQLYRGFTFGGYFGMYRGESWKPMLVTEFGVDAYNDACGWPESNTGGCFNMLGEAAGGAEDTGHFWGCAEGGECAKPGVQAQAEWDVRLAQELMNQYVDRGGIVWGGFLMAWTDEWWKGGGTQDLCALPCKTWDEAWCRGPGRANYRPGGSAMCSWRAHFTCPNFDTNYHDLCGYFLAAAPDNYVNEEWFGITAPIDCGAHKVNPDGVDGGYRLDSLYVRPAFLQMMQLWAGLSEVDTTHATCDALRPCWQCSISHTIDDLNDGACERECAVTRLAVGPGSSVPVVPKSIGNAILHGSTDVDSFWSKFGVPIGVGVVILTAAILMSVVLWQRRRAAKRQALEQPLLRPAGQ